MQTPIKVGIVGANWTLFHAHAWRNVPGAEVVAICTAHQDTAERAAAENNIPRSYWRLEDMLADPEITVVNVGTRPAQRYDMVMAALAAGKHVYNCLPFATDAAKAGAMHKLQSAKGLVGAVDAQWRWTPAIRRMKELIDEGAIGEFFTATIHLQLALYDYDDLVYTLCTLSGTTKPYHWLTQSASGASAWRNFGSHTILNLMYLFGEIEEIVGTSHTFVKDLHFPDGTRIRPDTDDFGLAMLRFRNGGLANINVSWAMADAPGYFLEVCGSKGRLVARDAGFCDSTTTLYHGGTRPGEPGGMLDVPDRLFTVEGTNFSKQNAPLFMVPLTALLADMARVVRVGAGEASPSFAEAAHAHRAVEAAALSKALKCWVRVDEMDA